MAKLRPTMTPVEIQFWEQRLTRERAGQAVSFCRTLALTRKGDRMGILLRLSSAAERGAFRPVSARNISTRGYIGIDKDDRRPVSTLRRFRDWVENIGS